MKVLVKRIGNHTLPLPKYETEGAAGMDLRASLGWAEGSLLIGPGERALVSCGFGFAIPPGHEGQVRPRSGLSRKGVDVEGGPLDGFAVTVGTIDSDYRGAVGVIVANNTAATVSIEHGQRVAQLVVAAVAMPPQVELVEVTALPPTARGDNGFGSTGTGAGEVTP